MKRYYWLVTILSVIFLSIILYGCGGGSKEEENASNASASNVVESIPVNSIFLSADVTKVTTNGGETGKAKITIKVTDSNGTGLRKEVRLKTNLGTLKDANGNVINKITTDDYGEAEFYFESGENPGTATITAEADGVSSKIGIEVVKIGAISFTADKQYLLKNDSTLLHVQVNDIHGEPASGIKVKISSENASVVSVGLDTLTTDEEGKASVYVTAGAPTQNKSVTLTAQSGDKTAELTLTVLIPKKITLTITPQTINTGGETATLTAQVTDEAGNPIPQIQVSFSTTLGEITPAVATTDNKGVAIAYLKSGDVEGNATITATAGILENSTTIYIIKSDVVNVPAFIEVKSIETNQIYIKGSGNKETSKITFIVKDGEGNPIPNVRIQFSLVGGSQGGEYLVPTSGVTDENGEVSTTLKAGTKPLAVKIRAWYNDEVYTETEKITICSGPPEGKHLSMAVQYLNIIGLIKDGIEDENSARLADLYSNPVPEGTAVHFESEYAKIEGSDVSTGGEDTEPGVASASLFSQYPRPVNGAAVHIWAQTQSGGYAYISSLYVNGDTIYAGTDGGGVFRTTDAGENWENIGKPRSYSEGLKGLWGTYINDMEIKDNLIVVATEDGGVLYSEDGGYNWRDLRSRSDRVTEYNVPSGSSLTYYPINLRERILVDGGLYISWEINGKIFSAADGSSHTVTYDINYGTPSTPAKFVKILDKNTFFAYFVGKGVLKFDKTQLHWFDFSQGLPQKDISTLVLVDTDNDNVKDTIYVTIGGQVYKSVITNANFQSVGSVQPVSFNDAFVSGTDIYYATTEGVKKFDTLTNTWSDITFTGCPVNNIKHIVVADDGTVYIGTDLGIYRIENSTAYPLNVYKERQQFTNETKEITLAYPSDQDKTHTTIYINGVELSSTYYEFENETKIKIRNDVDPIPAGAIVEIYYTLKPDNSTNYVSAPQKKITALYYANNKLYFGTENRKVYVLENPANASNGELPKIRDISGLTNKITLVLYKTTEVMFSGHTTIQAFWDTDGDGYFDNGAINIPNGGAFNILVIVSDENGRPLVSGSEISFTCDVGKTDFQSVTLPDVQYGGDGVTEYWIRVSDADPSDTDPPASGSLEIKVTSENDNMILTIPVTID